jgi:hypothetical protein
MEAFPGLSQRCESGSAELRLRHRPGLQTHQGSRHAEYPESGVPRLVLTGIVGPRNNRNFIVNSSDDSLARFGFPIRQLSRGLEPPES